MIKLYRKPASLFFMPFSTDMGLDFCIFLAYSKKLKKPNTYISAEGQAERWTERQKLDISPNHHTTGWSNKPSRQWFFLKSLIWPKH